MRFNASWLDERRTVDLRKSLERYGRVPVLNSDAGLKKTANAYFNVENPHDYRARLELYKIAPGLAQPELAAYADAGPRERLRLVFGTYDDRFLRGKWVDLRTEAERLRDSVRDARSGFLRYVEDEEAS